MPSKNAADVLDDLQAGVEASDVAAVKRAVDDLQAEYDRIETSEQVLLQQAVTARDKTSVSREHRQKLDSLARTIASVALPRSSVLTFGTYYVTEPSRVDESQVLDAADALAVEESSLVEAAEQADPVLDEVELPPALGFVGIEEPTDAAPKGSMLESTVTVRNVGDSPAEGVAISAESDLPVSPEHADLGALAPDSGATATFAVSASIAGTVTVEFTGDGENVDDASEAIEVTVLDKGGYLDRIQEDLDGTMQTLGEAGLPRGTAKGVEAKLETAIQKVDDAEQFVDRGMAGRANNMLGAAANALGAALNQLDGGRNGNGNAKSGDKGGNGGQSDGEPGLLFGAVESLIDELATARAAEL
jgi:hypothetical protein